MRTLLKNIKGLVGAFDEVPMVEAMACLVLADHALRQRAARLTFGA